MLTEQIITALNPGKNVFQLTDLKGLYLRVAPSGKKTFFCDLHKDGRRIKRNYGTWPELSLSDARKMHQQAIADAAQQKDLTFEDAFLKWERFKAPQVEPQTFERAKKRLYKHVMPTFKHICIKDITAPMLVDAMQHLEEQGKSETLRRCVGIVNEILDYCTNYGLIHHNPCTRVRSVFVSKAAEHRAAIGADELPELAQVVKASSLVPSAKLFIVWSLCSMLRPIENAALQWSWIDKSTKTLTIPSEVMKMRKAHRVPLTALMLDILHLQSIFCGLMYRGAPHVWASDTKAGHISTNALSKFLREHGFKNRLVPHGFRALARTWMAEQGFAPELCEACLAHVEKSGVVRAYQRSDYLEQRREIMDKWSAVIQKDFGSIIEELKQGI